MSYNHLCGDYNSGSNSYRKYKIFDDGFNIETKIRNNIGIPVIHASVSNRNSKRKRKSRERCKLFKKEFRLIDLPMSHVQFIQFRVITISIERREDKKFTRRKKYRSLYADLRYCSTYETTRKDRLDSRWIQNWIETSSCDD